MDRAGVASLFPESRFSITKSRVTRKRAAVTQYATQLGSRVVVEGPRACRGKLDGSTRKNDDNARCLRGPFGRSTLKVAVDGFALLDSFRFDRRRAGSLVYAWPRAGRS